MSSVYPLITPKPIDLERTYTFVLLKVFKDTSSLLLITIEVERVNEEDHLSSSEIFKEDSSVSVQIEDDAVESVPLVKDARYYISQGGVELCTEGVGGTYFIKDPEGKKIAVFKPVDEEPGAKNDPKKLLDQPFLPPGGGAIREVSAYLIDQQGHSRARVPETYLLENVKGPFATEDEKSGSLQKFIQNIGDSGKMGNSRYPVQDVHDIGILDMRLFNMDRNCENILVTKENGEFRLIPIDHTYTLPDKLDNAWFDWLTWKQSRIPFSAETLEFIDTIDINNDSEILRKVGIEEECIRTMKLSTLLLKYGAKAGLTLFEIASLVCRSNSKEESFLEKLVNEIERNCTGNFFEDYEKRLCEFFKLKNDTERVSTEENELKRGEVINLKNDVKSFFTEDSDNGEVINSENDVQRICTEDFFQHQNVHEEKKDPLLEEKEEICGD